ncbi:TIGR00725 family protein [candidate division WOR-3 bacterium]|nr:TIGR00725 family protein [candidate division WOR-3 bacterium]
MKQIAVIGSSVCSDSIYNDAFNIGVIIATKGYTLISGGGGGVMEASCKGVKSINGNSVCILPSFDKNAANNYCDIIIPSGIGEMRNFMVVRSADIIISIDGGYGTLSEIAIAKKENKKILFYKPSDLVITLAAEITVLNSIKDIDRSI